ncbi:MAG: DUF302 domain-containing protein [Neisseria sp.]|nr:DUF302 domain-containing protein [Neisseria sp.]
MKHRLTAMAAALALAACAGTHTGPHQPPQEAQTMEKIHSIDSRYGFEETLSRLREAVQAKGMTVFALIDHREAAQKAGLDMQPATVMVFGTPKAGTPLMLKDPSFALQLPLKVLVTEENGRVKVVFNDTRALIDGSGIAYAEVENSLAQAEKLIAKTVSE